MLTPDRALTCANRLTPLAQTLSDAGHTLNCAKYAREHIQKNTDDLLKHLSFADISDTSVLDGFEEKELVEMQRYRDIVTEAVKLFREGDVNAITVTGHTDAFRNDPCGNDHYRVYHTFTTPTDTFVAMTTIIEIVGTDGVTYESAYDDDSFEYTCNGTPIIGLHEDIKECFVPSAEALTDSSGHFTSMPSPEEMNKARSVMKNYARTVTKIEALHGAPHQQPHGL